jgi:GAF domain-containing protein
MFVDKRYITVQFNEAELRARNRALAVLLDISNFLARSQKLGEVLAGALDKVLEHFHLDAGRIYLMDEGGQSLTLAAHRGIEVSGLEQVKITEGFTGKAARSSSFILQDVSDLDDLARAALLQQKGFKIIICVPLVAMGSVVGVLNLAVRRPIELDQGEIDLFIVIGNQIAIAIQNAKLYESLESKIREVAAKSETIKFFAYSALHDLKSPLIGIHGLSRRLHKQYRALLDERGQSYCDQILKAAGQVEALVERINAYISAKETRVVVTVQGGTLPWIDKGTPRRIIRAKNKPYLVFRTGYQPKTEPGQSSSSGGLPRFLIGGPSGASGDWVRVKQVEHEIRPRRFTEHMAEYWRIEWPRRMDAAVKRGKRKAQGR